MKNLLARLILGNNLTDIKIDTKIFNSNTDVVTTFIRGYEIRTTRNSNEYRTEIYKIRYRLDIPKEPIFIKNSKSLEEAARIHILLEDYINSL